MNDSPQQPLVDRIRRHFFRDCGVGLGAIALNAMLWISKMEVPEGGVESTVSAEDMAANLDEKGSRK